jgi:MFS family permease
MLAVQPLVWSPLRVISGFCLAGLTMVIESWLNERADNTNRGQIFAGYMVVNLGAVTLGQLILASGDPAGASLFAVTAIAITLALVPVSLTRSAAPRPIQEVRLRWRRLYQLSPVGVIGCLFVGLGNGAFGGLAPVFAQRSGLSTIGIALFMSAALLGGALAQIPLGRLSDKIDRRRVLVCACACAMVFGLTLAVLGTARVGGTLLGWPIPFDAPPRGVLIAVAPLFGASLYPLYALCVSHTNDFVSREEFVEASSGLLLTWGVGASIGPLIAPQVMDRLGHGGLFVYTATIHGGFALFTLYRMTRRSAVPAGERAPFVATGRPARTSPVAIALDPRTEGDGRA